MTNEEKDSISTGVIVGAMFLVPALIGILFVPSCQQYYETWKDGIITEKYLVQAQVERQFTIPPHFIYILDSGIEVSSEDGHFTVGMGVRTRTDVTCVKSESRFDRIKRRIENDE